MKQPYSLVRARPEPEFEISVDGTPVPVVPGQTIGAALHGAGIRSWRATRFGGRPRGLFCGIGVCFDCLVTVNGTPSLRACLTEARPGDRVSTGMRDDRAEEGAARETAGERRDERPGGEATRETTGER
ncbi:(2Fe-2S)-binding protein [Streptosporangium sp. NPDC000396]|uniref:(2Fe-2S)-binding protein n=1 Tax=Streptosporangium sp. NPDC000396 TaxID=3366185 RepID=UPI00367C5270